ncbi:unnamed protein product [Oncorhynchus mykiss]|uniref:Nucleolar protein 5A n=1 Tax=Oncorhynchus mykiss TaxID=8022 RepID=A0A060X2L1_ONCMY|nr:unnamed protein product [Oncorhynchus mykiss]
MSINSVSILSVLFNNRLYKNTVEVGSLHTLRLESLYIREAEERTRIASEIVQSCEWYGYRFPELIKIVTDNSTYCKMTQLIGNRKELSEESLESLEEVVMDSAKRPRLSWRHPAVPWAWTSLPST